MPTRAEKITQLEQELAEARDGMSVKTASAM